MLFRERGALSLENGNAQHARVRGLGFGLAVEKDRKWRKGRLCFVCLFFKLELREQAEQ